MRRARLAVVAASLLSSGLAPGLARAAAPPAPWESSFLAAAPAEVLAAAARAKPPAGASAVMLFDERVDTYQDAQRFTSRYRRVYQILEERVAAEWDSVEVGWSPWLDDKPTVRARVVTADGRVLVLDPKTIEVSGAAATDNHVYTDEQVVRAPLPGVAAGAVVETEVTIVGHAALFDAGASHRMFFDHSYPVGKARLVVDAPASVAFRHVVRGLPGLAQSETVVGGRRALRFEGGPFAARPEAVLGEPPETSPGYVGYTTGAGWGPVAAAYADVIDRQLGRPDLTAEVRDAKNGLDPRRDRDAIIGRLVTRLGADVKYTGVEFGQASVVPSTPAEIRARRYGDCKDKALLLTALLRAAGIPANVALLSAGFDLDVDPDLPGLGEFDHAIVVVPGGKPLWIDATDRFSTVGELPLGDQGRLALIASRGTTGLVRTPEAPSSANATRELRTLTVGDDGTRTRVVEVSDMAGAAGHSLRAGYSTSERKDIDEHLGRYARETYKAKTLARWKTSDLFDVRGPLHMELETDDSALAQVTDESVVVTLPTGSMFERLPELLRDPDHAPHGAAASAPDRKLDYFIPEAYSHELRYRVPAPRGYVADAPPAAESLALGPATFTTKYRVEADGAVVAEIRFDVGKRRYTAAELRAFLVAVRTLNDRPIPSVSFHEVGEAALKAGHTREAITAFRRLLAEDPGSDAHPGQLARAYLEAGLGAGARAELARAATKFPGSARVQRALGWTLEHDLFGRRLTSGADPKGAERAYRRALELDATDLSIGESLAILLEHDADGTHTFRVPRARLDEVLGYHRALLKATYKGAVVNYALDLLRAERYADVVAEKATFAGEANTRSAYLAARAVISGAAEAIQEATLLSPTVEAARAALQEAGVELMEARRYPLAAAVLEEAGKASDRGVALALSRRLRATHRHEEATFDDRTPAGAAKALAAALAETAGTGDAAVSPRVRAVMTPALAATDAAAARALRLSLAAALPSEDRPVDLPLAVLADVVASTDLEVQTLAGGVRRVLWTKAGDAGATRATPSAPLFVAEGEHWRVLGVSADESPIGGEALRLVGAGDLDGARRLLDFASDGGGPFGGDELAQPPLPRLWTKGAPGTARAVRIAAAALAAGGRQPEGAIAPLVDCIAKPHLEAAPAACGGALLGVYSRLTDHTKEGAKLASDLLGAFPQSRAALVGAVTFSRRANREVDSKALLEPRVAGAPSDATLALMLVDVLLHLGDVGRADAVLAGLARAGDEPAKVANRRAWLRLVRNTVDDEALSLARSSVEATRRQSPSYLNTLAAVEAELNRPEEAYGTLVETLALREDGAPTPDDWYVAGRIAEDYGAVDVARDAYARVPRPAVTDRVDAWNLADRRLRGLKGAR